MGFNFKILSEESVERSLYDNYPAILELREYIHFHEGNLRALYTKEEFLKVSDMFIAARKTYDEMGQPEPNEQDITLAATHFDGPRLYESRVALEYTKGGAPDGEHTIHFHYRNFRTHLTKGDFEQLAKLFGRGLETFYQIDARLARGEIVPEEPVDEARWLDGPTEEEK